MLDLLASGVLAAYTIAMCCSVLLFRSMEKFIPKSASLGAI